MNYEMRVEEHSNPLVVFMHQMIPHHENAVNMARYLNVCYMLMQCVGGDLFSLILIMLFHINICHCIFQNCIEARSICGGFQRRDLGRAGPLERHHQHSEQADPGHAGVAGKVVAL